MSIGSDLREAREAKGITLEKMSQRTRIPVKYLEALEENRYDVFPSQTYAKAFIRACAKVVGLDQAALTRQFKSQNPPEEMKVEPKNIEAEMEKTLGWRPTLSRSPFSRQEDPSDPVVEAIEAEEYGGAARHEASVVRKRAALLKPGRWMGRAFQGLAVLVVAGLAGWGIYAGWQALPHITFSHPQATPPPAVVPADAENPSGYPPDKYHHLILKALDDSWVRISKDDGKATYEFQMKMGDTHIYKALKDFKLRVGNAGGVQVMFDGKDLGPLGVQGQVAEMVLPEGADYQEPQPTPTDTDGDDDNAQTAADPTPSSEKKGH